MFFEDVNNSKRASGRGVDASGQYHFLCLSTQPLPKKATEISRQTILPGETAIDYLEIVLMVIFVMLHCFHMQFVSIFPFSQNFEIINKDKRDTIMRANEAKPTVALRQPSG